MLHGVGYRQHSGVKEIRIAELRILEVTGEVGRLHLLEVMQD